MLFDAHCDVWTDVTRQREKGERDVIRRRHLANFKKGGLGGGVFAIWNDQPERPSARLAESIHAMCEELWESRDYLAIIDTRQDYYDAVNAGKLGVLLGVEGLSGIGENVKSLYLLHRLGIRLASLTWNEQNDLATGTAGDPQRGLTPAGRQAVGIIQKLDMILDVSHANDKTFWDIAQVAEKPFVATHSNARALCDVPRNLSDAQLKAIAEAGGMVGINAFHEFISTDDSLRHLDHLIDHIVYIADFVGIDHIFFGFDFFEYLGKDITDWITTETYKGTRGFETFSKAPALVERLAKRGFTPEEVEGLRYRNFLSLLPN